MPVIQSGTGGWYMVSDEYWAYTTTIPTGPTGGLGITGLGQTTSWDAVPVPVNVDQGQRMREAATLACHIDEAAVSLHLAMTGIEVLAEEGGEYGQIIVTYGDMAIPGSNPLITAIQIAIDRLRERQRCAIGNAL